MLPNELLDAIYKSVNALHTNIYINKYFVDNNISFDYNTAVPYFQDESVLGRSICAYCSKAEYYLDYIEPTGANAAWTRAIRATLRCSEMMDKMTIDYAWFVEKPEQIPGQLQYRCACPRFEPHTENEEKE